MGQGVKIMTIPSKSKTIDNLGPGVSKRYAEDVENTDRSLIRDSRKVPTQTYVTTTAPSYKSQVDDLLEIKQPTSWATFEEPKNFTSHNKNLFTFQLIPSMGTVEQQQTNKDQINIIKEQEDQQEQEQEEPEEEEDIDKVVKLLDWMGILDKYILFINGKRGQYHKG